MEKAHNQGEKRMRFLCLKIKFDIEYFSKILIITVNIFMPYLHIKKNI